MPFISELVVYPIKSCAGIALREATITSAGLMTQYIYDREWMVVDEDGCFLTQREYPQMAQIVPRIKADTLELRAPGMLRLEVPLDLPHPDESRIRNVQVWNDVVPAYDCDDMTATWFSKLLGASCRLARFHPDAKRRAESKWVGELEAPTLFSDGYPVLVISSASLDELNQRLTAQGRAALPMNRFRPNLVISDTLPHEEDMAETLTMGDVVLKPIKPCARCSIPSVDQETGQVGDDPLDILSTYRANARVNGAITFGMNAILLEGEDAVLRVGQEVRINLAF
jgi:uncharacterized protein YcbX